MEDQSSIVVIGWRKEKLEGLENFFYAHQVSKRTRRLLFTYRFITIAGSLEVIHSPPQWEAFAWSSRYWRVTKAGLLLVIDSWLESLRLKRAGVSWAVSNKQPWLWRTRQICSIATIYVSAKYIFLLSIYFWMTWFRRLYNSCYSYLSIYTHHSSKPFSCTGLFSQVDVEENFDMTENMWQHLCLDMSKQVHTLAT